MVSQALGVLRGMISQAASIGSAIINGIVSGLSSAGGRVISYLRDLASRALAAAKAALGIASPSKAFALVGEQIGAGLAVGIAKSEAQVSHAVDRMADVALDSADRISEVVGGSGWASSFDAKVNASLADLSGASGQDAVVGQLRGLRGDVSSVTPGDLLIVAELRALRAERRSGGAADAAQLSRTSAELGAF